MTYSSKTFKATFFTLALFACFAISCKKETKAAQKKEQVSEEVNQTSENQPYQKPKAKVGTSNTPEQVFENAMTYANQLNFDLDYIRNKGLADKKYFAEFLGLYLKLHKTYTDESTREEIRKRIQPFYEETQHADFHNMGAVDDRLFKKNSMSYMRIMWLFKELGFDISYFKEEFYKVKDRMDKHMRIRGQWQRVVFDKYYDFFELEKPDILERSKNLKGPITTQQPVTFYNRMQSYILTHFVFAAYDYGNSITQDKFTQEDLDYLFEILPPLVEKFEKEEDDDLVAELLTCMVFIKQTGDFFQRSYNRLLYRQNNDGSFGNYEKYRPKIGSDVEFRAYLHTTLVALEMFVEYEYRMNP